MKIRQPEFISASHCTDFNYNENLCFDSAQQPVIEQSRNTG